MMRMLLALLILFVSLISCNSNQNTPAENSDGDREEAAEIEREAAPEAEGESLESEPDPDQDAGREQDEEAASCRNYSRRCHGAWKEVCGNGVWVPNQDCSAINAICEDGDCKYPVDGDRDLADKEAEAEEEALSCEAETAVRVDGQVWVNGGVRQWHVPGADEVGFYNMSVKRQTWQATKAYCEGLGDCWRMPTVGELKALVNCASGDSDQCPLSDACSSIACLNSKDEHGIPASCSPICERKDGWPIPSPCMWKLNIKDPDKKLYIGCGPYWSSTPVPDSKQYPGENAHPIWYVSFSTDLINISEALQYQGDLLLAICVRSN